MDPGIEPRFPALQADSLPSDRPGKPLFRVYSKESTCQCRRCRRHRFDPMGKILWRRAWQPTPVFLPGESHGQRILAGSSPRGCKKSEQLRDSARMHRGPYYQHGFITVDAELDHLAEVAFARSLCYKGTLSSFPSCTLRKEITM